MRKTPPVLGNPVDFMRNRNHLNEEELRAIASCLMLGFSSLYEHGMIPGVTDMLVDDGIGPHSR